MRKQANGIRIFICLHWLTSGLINKNFQNTGTVLLAILWLLMSVGLREKGHGYSKAAAEVCKYALKFGDLSVEKTWEAFKVLKGKRLTGSFGLLWGVKIPDTMTDDMPLEDLPYLEMLYKFAYSKKSYYDLLITRHVEPHSKDNDDEAEIRQREEGGRSYLAITDEAKGRCRCEGTQSRNVHSEDVKKPTGESHLLPVFVFGKESEDGTGLCITLIFSHMSNIGY